MKSDWTEDTELHRIVDNLQAIEKRNFYRLNANVTRGRAGNYSHEMQSEIQTEVDLPGLSDYTRDEVIEGDGGDKGDLADVLRDFMRWIYRSLEAEHDVPDQ